jgi:predicted Fe-Mo cluster-binding NifX family protein
MKIAVTASDPSIDSPVDPRFGRCAYFLIVDPDTLAFEAIPNPNVIAMDGAGIRSAQLIAGKGAEVVLSGNYGPNAAQTLNAVGVGMIAGIMGGSVREAVQQFKQGVVQPVSQPTVGAYFGIGGSPESGRAAGGGRSMWRGRGRGMGAGRGMGRRGGAQGSRRGMARSGTPMDQERPDFPPPQPSGPPSSSQSELENLKHQAEIMSEQLREIDKLIKQLEQDEHSRQDTPGQ